MWVASGSEEVEYDCGVQAGVPIPATAVAETTPSICLRPATRSWERITEALMVILHTATTLFASENALANP
jgi:hypothetical protein